MSIPGFDGRRPTTTTGSGGAGDTGCISYRHTFANHAAHIGCSSKGLTTMPERSEYQQVCEDCRRSTVGTCARHPFTITHDTHSQPTQEPYDNDRIGTERPK